MHLDTKSFTESTTLLVTTWCYVGVYGRSHVEERTTHVISRCRKTWSGRNKGLTHPGRNYCPRKDLHDRRTSQNALRCGSCETTTPENDSNFVGLLESPVVTHSRYRTLWEAVDQPDHTNDGNL